MPLCSPAMEIPWIHISLNQPKRFYSLPPHSIFLDQQLVNLQFQLPNLRIASILHNFLFSLTNHFLFSTSSLLTCPKFLQLHWVSSLPHFAIFFITCVSASLEKVFLHIASTTRPHSLPKSHISSKRNGLEIGGGAISLGVIHRGEWSDVVHVRWPTFVLANWLSHSVM